VDFTNPYPRNTVVDAGTSLEIEANFVRFKTMVTPEDVVKHGLIGIPKTFPLTGEEISEEFIASHLHSVIGELEMQGMIMSPAIFHHIDDLIGEGIAGIKFFPTILKKFPVREIESIELRYPNAQINKPTLLYTIPKEWITFENGKVNVIATTGFLTPNLVSGSANIPLVNLFQTNYKPSGYRVNYKAGFDQDRLPVIVWHLVVDMTALNVITDIAPMMFSNTGINVGIDGVSQSAQLPGPRIFDGRVGILQARIKKNTELIKSYYGSSISLEFVGL
jgi:hypothetical protein